MNNKMVVLFATKLFLFLIILWGADKLLLYFEFNAPQKVQDKRFGLILNGQLKSDVLILGSSRPSRGIITGQLANEFQHSCYNLSYHGAGLPFTNFLVETYFRAHNLPPRYCIIALDDNFAFGDSGVVTPFSRSDVLMPFVGNSFIRSVLVKQKVLPYWPATLMVSCRLNWKFIRSNNSLPIDDNGNVDSLGSTIIEGHTTIIDVNKERADYLAHFHPHTAINSDPQNIKLFNYILDSFSRHGTKVAIIVCPINRQTDSLWEHWVRSIINNRAKYYHFEANHFDSSCFFDNGHLNKKGAKIFTHDLSTFLNREYSKI